MRLNNLLKEGNITLTVGLNDLKDFATDIIQQTKRELEELVVAQKSEAYISRQRASEMLDINLSTLWHWSNRNYLVPVSVGGKRRYKMSDINKILGEKRNG